jgi:hypothetical protein
MTIFVAQGDQYLTPVQLERRAQKYIRRSWPDQKREKSIRLGAGAFDAFMSTFSSTHDINITNNTFNWQLQEYRKATARLAQYVLAVGREEVYEDYPTGEYDPETGEELMESVLVQSAVDPLPATVEVLVYDEENPEAEPTTETVDNPEIVRDTEERASAQSIIDATPEEVLNFE